MEESGKSLPRPEHPGVSQSFTDRRNQQSMCTRGSTPFKVIFFDNMNEFQDLRTFE